MIETAAVPVLETDRLILRRPDIGDFPALQAFYATDRSRFVGGPQGLGECGRTLAYLIGLWEIRGFGMYTMVERASGTALGHCGLHYPLHWPEREIGWSLWLPESEGKGFATEAARAVLHHVFQGLGWDTAVSYIAHDNARSAALAQRLGAVKDTAAKTPGDVACDVFRHAAPPGMTGGKG